MAAAAALASRLLSRFSASLPHRWREFDFRLARRPVKILERAGHAFDYRLSRMAQPPARALFRVGSARFWGAVCRSSVVQVLASSPHLTPTFAEPSAGRPALSPPPGRRGRRRRSEYDFKVRTGGGRFAC